MKILVTGGAGYIGSHTCLQFLSTDHEVTVVDNLMNSSIESLMRVQKLADRTLDFVNCDITDESELNKVFAKARPEIVVHFAGLKSVSESVLDPEKYHAVNVGGTETLLNAMERVGCNRIVFSSSATVYGTPVYLPCDEKHPLNPINPYGKTKLICEELLKDWTNLCAGRKAVALRYFNPIGADSSGQIGEDPQGLPNNLMPLIAQVAVGRRKHLEIYGNDYQTIDGTGVRDYVHVTDLARAHIVAVKKIDELSSFELVNIGTGSGISVLQLLREFEKQSGRKLSSKIRGKRAGDAPEVWADVTKAKDILNFETRLGISEMCLDTWHWQSANPNGY